MGLVTRASSGVKLLGVAVSLGACAPFVVFAILLQRDLRKRTARLGASGRRFSRSADSCHRW